MATYSERFDLVESAAFKKRIQTAVWVAAVGVIDEDPATGNHANRLTWARDQLKGPLDLPVARRVAIYLVGSGVDQVTTDADLQTEIDAIVNTLANNS